VQLNGRCQNVLHARHGPPRDYQDNHLCSASMPKVGSALTMTRDMSDRERIGTPSSFLDRSYGGALGRCGGRAPRKQRGPLQEPLFLVPEPLVWGCIIFNASEYPNHHLAEL
jgi:hypothetical protein